jgi:hypothetical protein
MADRDEVAKKIAQTHYRIEPGITAIYTICDNTPNGGLSDAPIRLLEVNANTPPSGILPIQFDPVPASGIPYPSVIVEVTPGEFEKIRRQELPLPHGWAIGPLVPKPALEGAGE